MENKLQVMPVNDIMIMAKTFAESGMFPDIRSLNQAFVKIQAGQEVGIPPFQSMSGIHVIKGKTTIGAGIIASAVKGSGKYDYKVPILDDKTCSIDFYEGKEKIGNSTFTIEDAKRAGTQNTDKFPRNMLFARAISNGVKWFCPDVFSGPVYVPEEMQHIEDTTHEVVNDVKQIEVVAEKETPVLTEKQLNTLLSKDLKTLVKYFDKIKSGELIADADQLMSISNQIVELKLLGNE